MIKNILKIVMCSSLFMNVTINAMLAKTTRITAAHLTQQIRNTSQKVIATTSPVFSVEWYLQEAAKFNAHGKQKEAQLLLEFCYKREEYRLQQEAAAMAQDKMQTPSLNNQKENMSSVCCRK